MSDATNLDLVALEGVLEQIGFEENGVANAHDELDGMGTFTTFTRQRFSVRTPEGMLVLEGSFQLDATTTPKQIDYVDDIGPDAGLRLPAIYMLQGASFVFIAGDSGAPRPTVFKTRPGQTMRRFKRL